VCGQDVCAGEDSALAIAKLFHARAGRLGH
jgi:hypothetical protein